MSERFNKTKRKSTLSNTRMMEKKPPQRQVTESGKTRSIPTTFPSSTPIMVINVANRNGNWQKSSDDGRIEEWVSEEKSSQEKSTPRLER